MSKRTIVYADNNATTPVDPQVKAIMNRSIKTFCGNPSSTHTEGATSRDTVETCRKQCALMLECQPEDVYFTSGATESNNIILQGFIQHLLAKGKRPRILCSGIEHVSVLNVLRHFKDQIDLFECPVRNRATDAPNGYVSPDDVERLVVEHKIDLVTVAMVNHEIGTIQPIQAIAEVAKRHGAFMHSDYTQAVGRFPVFPEVDAISFSAHKFYGPKGVGGLVLRHHAKHLVDQLMFGGDQEIKLRPGTENVTGIIGMTAALEITVRRREKDMKHLERLVARLFRQLRKHEIAHYVNSATGLALNLTFYKSKLTSDELIRALSKHGICVSKGAACKSRTAQESYVLAAVGTNPSGPTIRIGIGRFNRTKDIDYLVNTLKSVL